MTDSRRVRGVVLAGGRSTRFDGGDKALAPLDGLPLIAHVVAAVDDGTDGLPVLAVADESQGERLRSALGERTVETVRDGDALTGPLAGLFSAVAAVDAPWLFVCACDMPLVTPAGIETLRAQVTAAEAVPDDTPETAPVEAVVPVVDGFDQPLHALYRRQALDGVADDLSAGDALMGLLDRLTVRRVDAADADAPLAAATTNVNTRADLDAVREAEREYSSD